MEPLGIVFTELGPDFLRGDHAGRCAHAASPTAAARRRLGAAGRNPRQLRRHAVRGEGEGCVGIEINANHVRGVREGLVTGTARPLHVGRQTQVWEIRIEDERGKLVCISRLTLAVRRSPRRQRRSACERPQRPALRAAHAAAALARAAGGPAADDAADDVPPIARMRMAASRSTIA
jgi:1,4-dihydroxy-2-naphthoyl-CoA hydrolase